MKLSKIYCDRPKKFRPIVFNSGFNVLYARVTRPKDSAKDSHNLGKTILISLIDFLMISGLSKGHFLYDHSDLFKDFVFFLEIELNDGRFLTIRRSVELHSKVSFKIHDASNEDFSALPDTEWDHDKLPFKKARTALDGYLNLTAISPWNYRKGVSYFLRTQADYQDVFQINKFSKGPHADWKPYLASLFGFSRELIETKYSTDKEIEGKKEFRKNYSQEVKADLSEFDRIKGMVEIKRKEVAQARDNADRFDFLASDLEINADLVSTIEAAVAQYNEELYEIKYEIDKIKESLGAKIKFDLAKVKQLFEESQIYLAANLVREYKDLLRFNERLSEERNRRLSERLATLVATEKDVEKSLAKSNRERERVLSVLQNRDTFSKFRLLQSTIVEQEVEIARLEAELENLNAMTRIDREIRTLTQQRQETVNKIEDEVNAGNDTYSAIRQRFNEIIRDVLSLPALVSTSVNAEGNMEYDATVIQDEKSLQTTSEGKGTSYRKLLCAAFDISVLETYADKSFYRFVYHDGILEGLDNRKKMRFLAVVNEYCIKYDLQYILTVIDADLPRDDNDEKIPFPPDVVVREFHERGQDGRLFNMPTF